jgi:hypothetical protein
VAADIVIGDHGSVGLYATALGRPLILAAFGDSELVPSSPVAWLGSRVPRLSDHSPIDDQIEAATNGFDSELSNMLRDMSFALEGRSHAAHRTLLYELLGLDEPKVPVHVAMVPPPEFSHLTVGSWLVKGSVTQDTGSLTIRLRRYPALISRAEDVPAHASHTLANASCDDPYAIQTAAAIFTDNTSCAAEPMVSLEQVLDLYPGARVAAGPVGNGTWQAAIRNVGGVLVALEAPFSSFDEHLIASAVYQASLALQWRLPVRMSLTINGEGQTPIVVHISRITLPDSHKFN